MAETTTSPLVVGNCSGFYGDRLSAMREMLEGGPLDVLTGDYLAELTMLILGKDTLKDPSGGYAKTFVRQAEDCLGLALERGVRIVANAGGLNPAGLAERLREVATGLGLDPRIAYVAGDDVRGLAAELGLSRAALTANAYLGGFGIARALQDGADVVVTGRVTDASLVVGPAAAHHGWAYDDLDQLAGAVVAGHVLECGTQATGGNFSGFRGLPDGLQPLGFPIAEIAADGSSVITKHPGTGGAVTVDTVTAQLMYEIQGQHYLGPDVTTDLTSIRLTQQGEDRVAVTGVRGTPPPSRLKVCVNELGGYRNSVEFVLTGLEIDAKAAWIKAQVEAAVDRDALTALDWSTYRVPEPDSPTEEGASCLLRLSVQALTADPVGKDLTAPVIELALGTYPGFHVTAPPARPTPFGYYTAAYVDRAAVSHTVVRLRGDADAEVVPDPTTFAEPADVMPQRPAPQPAPAEVVTRRAPLGSFVHARSGDKGGDANLGLWVAQGVSTSSTSSTYADDLRERRAAWLAKLITPEKVRELVPEAAALDVEVHPLPNLGGVNVLIRGLLGRGVAASTRFDPQAKGLGEWVRSRLVNIQEDLL
ncbi:MAG TPA: acyclic terpene utilization AtuA family protein [Nocardioides sp.]|uniref:acyclic terpene utilization AtuA family protein n=1 Tax=Nocardioides sp. TaxID=35761 RepID=UPI002ED9F516